MMPRRNMMPKRHTVIGHRSDHLSDLGAGRGQEVIGPPLIGPQRSGIYIE